MKIHYNIFKTLGVFLLIVFSFILNATEQFGKEKKSIEKIIEATIETHDYKMFEKLLSKYELNYFWVPVSKAKYNEYRVLYLYLKVVDIKTKNALLYSLLRDVGTLYFIRLVDDGVVTNEDFSFNKDFNYHKSLLCVMGNKGYFDLFREFIYKNNTPYSIYKNPNNWFETELHYAILSNDINAVKYVLNSGYLKHIGLNFEKKLGKEYFMRWVYTEKQEKEDEERMKKNPNPYKGKIIMENFRGDPLGFPLALAIRGATKKNYNRCKLPYDLPSFDIIKLLIEKGARGISKKKALELLEKTKGQRNLKEYGKIKEYIQKNYPDDKP